MDAFHDMNTVAKLLGYTAAGAPTDAPEAPDSAENQEEVE